MSRYSLNRRDKKVAGVASTLGELFNIDPTFIRIGFVAAFFFISWEFALVAYVAAGIYLSIKKRKALRGEERMSDFDRMGEVGKGRSSIHDLRNTLAPPSAMEIGSVIFCPPAMPRFPGRVRHSGD